MPADLKSIRVLRYNLDKAEHIDFEEGDIVNIYTNEGYGRTYTGKITWIDTQWIEVDCNTQYKADIRKFNFRDFYDIEKVCQK